MTNARGISFDGVSNYEQFSRIIQYQLLIWILLKYPYLEIAHFSCAVDTLNNYDIVLHIANLFLDHGNGIGMSL